MAQRIPFFLFSPKSTNSIGRRMSLLGRSLAGIKPDLGETLSKIGYDTRPEYYAASALLSAFFYGVLFFLLSFAVLSAKADMISPELVSFCLGFLFWFLFFMLHLFYPKIIVKKMAAKESRELLFALREMLVDVQSGVPLFDSMKNVSAAGYGYVSGDFAYVVKQVESGVSEHDALKSLALKSESEYLKRAVWQMVNALESGASIGTALASIVDSLEIYLYREIRNYSANLNFLMLIYMMSAAVVPSLGITFLVLLSAFNNFGITIETVAGLVGFSMIMQIILIGYMSSTRPHVFGG